MRITASLVGTLLSIGRSCHVVKNLVVDRDFDIGFRYGVGFYDDFRLRLCHDTST